MARVCVVGNATKDLNRTGLISARRPGGTLLYASLALLSLDHDVHPIGHAPLRAYLWLRRTGVPLDDLRLAWPGTQFLNEYDGQDRRQWARPGPREALRSSQDLHGYEGVLLGPVLGEVPGTLEAPATAISLLDLQGSVRRLGSPNLLGWREVDHQQAPARLPEAGHVRGSIEEVTALTGEEDPLAAARSLQGRTGAVAIVTLGAQGAVGVDGSSAATVRPPVLEIDDPTGAGDVFDAGFLHARLEGQGLVDALATACAAAGAFLSRSWGDNPSQRFPGQATVSELGEHVEIEMHET